MKQSKAGKRVLIAPDKFKGTLSGLQAARCIRKGWQQARRQDETKILPICDGGDGFGESLARLEGARKMTCPTVDAAHRRIKAHWWWQEEKQMAIVESASVIGLAQLPKGKYHPFELDTYGLGILLQHAQSKGARTCVVGIGGSATNDGGFGMARALGWQFLDEGGSEIERWVELKGLSQIRRPRKRKLFHRLIIASDVTNPLLGREGASRIYGPQKGLRSKDMRSSEACLSVLGDVMDLQLGQPLQSEPGAGAAGGLGYGLMAFLGGKARSGFDYFAQRAKLDSLIRWSDWVVTGEGSLDQSTLMGKGVGGIALRCKDLDTPCFGLAGVSSHRKKLGAMFDRIEAICPHLTDSETAQREASQWLTRLAHQTADDIQM